MKVLFVCSGNICRSAMAAEYMRDRVARSGLSHVVVDSAGTLMIEGAPASVEAVETLREAGLDLSGHRSRGLVRDDIRTSDLVVVMADHHLDDVARMNPGNETEVRLLRAFERGPDPTVGAPDLDDPIGRPMNVYVKGFEVIRTCVDYLIMHLRHRD